MSCVSVWNTSIKSHVVGGYAKGTLWSIRSNPPLSDWSDLKVLVDQGQNFGKWRVMMMTILWWMLALRRGANFYKNWSKVEFPTNLRNKAAPPPPGGHPSIHHVESSSKTAFFFLLSPGWCAHWYGESRGWSKYRCRVLTNHGHESVGLTKRWETIWTLWTLWWTVCRTIGVDKENPRKNHRTLWTLWPKGADPSSAFLYARCMCWGWILLYWPALHFWPWRRPATVQCSGVVH